MSEPQTKEERQIEAEETIAFLTKMNKLDAPIAGYFICVLIGDEGRAQILSYGHNVSPAELASMGAQMVEDAFNLNNYVEE